MGGGRSERDQGDERGVPQSRRSLLVPWGWLLMSVGLVCVWLVYFTRQPEIGLFIGAGLFGLGYALHRSGSRTP